MLLIFRSCVFGWVGGGTLSCWLWLVLLGLWGVWGRLLSLQERLGLLLWRRHWGLLGLYVTLWLWLLGVRLLCLLWMWFYLLQLWLQTNQQGHGWRNQGVGSGRSVVALSGEDGRAQLRLGVET